MMALGNVDNLLIRCVTSVLFWTSAVHIL
jgi:hypothetical protein